MAVEHSSVGLMGAFRAEGPGHGFLIQLLKKGSGTSLSPGLYEAQGNSPNCMRSNTPLMMVMRPGLRPLLLWSPSPSPVCAPLMPGKEMVEEGLPPHGT